jgi:hypothetical protein
MHQKLLVLLTALVCTFNTYGQTEEPPKPLTVQGIRKWQSTGALDGWSNWPKQIKLDLRGNNHPALFLAISGFSRGMTYALFEQKGDSWRLLTDCVNCTMGMVDVLSTAHEGYHDFAAFQRSGRGGFEVMVFSWNGNRYVEKVNWEISYDELYNRDNHHDK